MAGASNRFKMAGYELPKFRLPAINHLNLFQCSLLSFKNYFLSEKFVIIFRSEFVKGYEIEKWCANIGLSVDKIVLIDLNHQTRGQAETVYKGLIKLNDIHRDELIIFNVDTVYSNFEKDLKYRNYIDVAQMSGDHWSFVRPSAQHPERAAEVTEKRRISNFCSIGLYVFENFQLYSEIYNKYMATLSEHEELYIAPMYQEMINKGIEVNLREVRDGQVLILGTPTEYEAYLSSKK
jgi:hypothetical protein